MLPSPFFFTHRDGLSFWSPHLSFPHCHFYSIRYHFLFLLSCFLTGCHVEMSCFYPFSMGFVFPLLTVPYLMLCVCRRKIVWKCNHLHHCEWLQWDSMAWNNNTWSQLPWGWFCTQTRPISHFHCCRCVGWPDMGQNRLQFWQEWQWKMPNWCLWHYPQLYKPWKTSCFNCWVQPWWYWLLRCQPCWWLQPAHYNHPHERDRKLQRCWLWCRLEAKMPKRASP